MRGPRHPGPPSTLSGSSASGRGLVHAYTGTRSHRARSTPTSVFVPGEINKPSAKTRTKVILILGIALPVLASVIGITAWAVTTDVLRATPRIHDHSFNNFGQRGKTKMNTMDSKTNEEFDVLGMHSLSQEENVSTVAPNEKNTMVPKKVNIPSVSGPALANPTVKQSLKPPTASEILSKLISDMPIPKTPKNFVVFAPVADTNSGKSIKHPKRFDGKVHLTDGTDLVAQESVASENVSQENSQTKTAFNRKRKSSREIFSPFKSTEIISLNSQQHGDGNRKIIKTQNRLEQRIPQPLLQMNDNPLKIKGFPEHQTKNLPQAPHLLNIPMTANKDNFMARPHSAQRDKMPFPPANIPNPMNNMQINSKPLQSAPQVPPFQTTRNTPQMMSQIGNANQNSQFHSGNSPSGQSFSTNSHRGPNYQPQYQEPQNHGQQPKQSSALNLPSIAPQNLNQPNSYTSDNTNLPGGAQYFSPQSFHTKTSYEPSIKYGSISSNEKVSQISTSDTSKDGQHHHHHHHHHHEPTGLVSDPLSDVNLSDVPNRNDADRLGTIGLGLGGPRGITVQIGGGGLGGGGLGGSGLGSSALTGLLPLGALGMARNVMNALMPRPRLGLNSKVFVGFELGRGRGLLLG